jgi:hypothetical protein
VEARANEGDSNNISEDAQQWKENEKMDIDDDTNGTTGQVSKQGF